MRIFQYIAVLIACICFLSSSILAQDKLLLTNGKIKKLNGTVVYYDNDEVLYQSSKQRVRMELFKSKEKSALKKKESSRTWLKKQEKRKFREIRKQEKLDAKLASERLAFEQEIEVKMKTMFASDFEIWKEKELNRLKAIDQKQKLNDELKRSLEGEKTRKKETRERNRFTSRISRDLTFSVLKSDGTEEIVYNADTLGYFADGEAEVEYGVEEMRMYIKGRQDGRKHSFHDVYIGAGVGLASALLLTYTWDAFYAPIPPAICIAVIAGIRKVKPSSKLMLTANELQSDPYMDGYYRSAKGRKIFAFTMGAIGGLGVGVTVGLLTNPLLQ